MAPQLGGALTWRVWKNKRHDLYLLILYITKKKMKISLLSGFSFMNIHESQDYKGRGGHFINSSLPLATASQTLRHQPGDYCRVLTSAHSQQFDSNWEPLVSKRKSLTTKLCALKNEDSHELLTMNKILNFYQLNLLMIMCQTSFSSIELNSTLYLTHFGQNFTNLVLLIKQGSLI